MASVDMCEHDWPGSGCKDCRAEREAARPAADDAGLREALERARSAFLWFNSPQYDSRDESQVAIDAVADIDAALGEPKP